MVLQCIFSLMSDGGGQMNLAPRRCREKEGSDLVVMPSDNSGADGPGRCEELASYQDLLGVIGRFEKWKPENAQDIADNELATSISQITDEVLRWMATSLEQWPGSLTFKTARSGESTSSIGIIDLNPSQ